MEEKQPIVAIASLCILGTALSACATVKVEAPDEPIEINLNVNIQQEVRVTLEKDVRDLIEDNPDIF
ncbi:MAG: YnbE family lipoprotein [Pseudomonadota bacterium]